MDLAPGTLLDDRFVIERLIGAGASCSVFAAVHRVTNERVALRCVEPWIWERCLAFEPEYVDRFRAWISPRQHQHENIIEIAELVETEDYVFAVTEYVDAPCLASGHQLPWPDVVEILRQLIGAFELLEHAGLYGVGVAPEKLHRGPTVLKLDCFDVYRPAKFAFKVQGAQDWSARAKHSAPEQLMGKPLDARTHVFSLGVLGYHLIAGHMPYDATTSRTLVTEMIKYGPPASGAPPHVDQVFRRCLQRLPSDRYPSLRALREALAAIE